jgi:hypothetical protein
VRSLRTSAAGSAPSSADRSSAELGLRAAEAPKAEAHAQKPE